MYSLKTLNTSRLRFQRIDVVVALGVYGAPDELDQVEDRAIQDGKREDPGDDVQVALLVRPGEAASREVL